MAEATAKAAGVQLLTRGELQRLFPDARIFNENFCGLTKSLVVMNLEAGRS
ncbi:hypothetical protein SDC9_182853 [bioreactor metagenome]|uniref:Uncharacterized protein n=1 Tax=bioreactor metagenome TaxID=1076179 RepID=A0A645H8N9_9ZZZZ